MRLYIILIILAMIGDTSFAQLADCTNIDSPGSYTLVSDLAGAPTSFGSTDTACIYINSSNVNLDCQDHQVDSNGTADSIGIVVADYGTTNFLNNVDIENCNIIDYDTAVYVERVNQATVTNSNISGNGQDGIYASRVNDIELTDLNVSGEDVAIELSVVTDALLQDNYVLGQGSGQGYYLRYVTDSTVSNNYAEDFYAGFRFQLENHNNHVIGNTAFDNYYGFEITSSNPDIDYVTNNCTFEDNVFNSNNVGIEFLISGTTPVVTDNIFRNNSGTDEIISYSSNSDLFINNNMSYLLLDQSDNTVTNNIFSYIRLGSITTLLNGSTVFPDFIDGIQINGGTVYNLLYVTGNDTSSVSVDVNNLFFRQNAPNGNRSRISITDDVDTREAYYISIPYSIPTLPANYHSFEGKFLQFVNETTPGSIDSIYWHWTNSESASYNEGDFEFWRYNGSWSQVPATFNNGLNRMVLTNFAPDGAIYGILFYDEPPSVSLVSPPNGAMLTSNLVDFEFTADDEEDNFFTCRLYIDNVLNQSDSDNSFNREFTSSVSDGLHSWRIDCEDSTGNIGSTATRNLTIDSQPPSITLNAPPDDTAFATGNVNLSFTATDNVDPSIDCNLSLDGSDAYILAANDTIQTQSYTGLSEGFHSWNVTCEDNVGNTATSPTRSFTVDTVPPSITLNSPPNNTIISVPAANILYTPTDNVDTSIYCELYVDVLADTASVANGTVENVSVPVTEGIHSWYVQCFDDANNTATSEIRIFEYREPSIAVSKTLLTSANTSLGGTVSFNITVTNDGNAVLYSVELNDDFPAYLDYLASSPAPDSQAGSLVTWYNLSSLAPGESASLVVEFNVTGPVPGIQNLTNDITAQGTAISGNTVNATDSEPFRLYNASVSVTKTDITPITPSQGGTIEYEVTVANDGNVTLNTLLSDILPANMSLSSANSSWNIVLAPGQMQTFYINATGPSGNYVNAVYADGMPPNGGNITAWSNASTTIELAQLLVEKSTLTTEVSYGGLVEFIINVTNNGTVDLNTTVNDSVPAGLTPLTNTSWNVDLSPGESAQFFVNATMGNLPNGTILTNVITAQGVPGNGDTVVETANSTIQILTAGISVNKSINDTNVDITVDSVYYLNVTNNGSVNLTAVVNDTIPGESTFVWASLAPNLTNNTMTWYLNLTPGESVLIEYNLSYSLDGNFTNNVSAVGTPSNGYDVSSLDSQLVTIYVMEEGGLGALDKLRLSFDSTCDENLITTTEGATILVLNADTLEVVSSGRARDGEYDFSGCSADVRIRASMQGALPTTIERSLISCSKCKLPEPECTRDAECPSDQFCEMVTDVGGACELYDCTADSQCGTDQFCAIANGKTGGSCEENPYECSVNDDCAPDEFCSIATGQSGGYCEDVIGTCGFVEKHRWVSYECGGEGCEPCGNKYSCIDNKCVPVRKISGGPKSVYLGDEISIRTEQADEPCSSCDLSIVLPSGKELTGRTNLEGKFSIPANFEGWYVINLMKDGESVDQIRVSSLEKPAAFDNQQTLTEQGDSLDLLVWWVLIVGMIAAALLWRNLTIQRGKKKEES